MDLMSRKILAHIALDAGFDLESVAQAVGCTPQVAADRIRKLQEQGVVRGFRADVDLDCVGSHHEALVVGVPSHATDPEALHGLAREPDVARVFTLASHASIAFHVHGSDPEALDRRAAELAHAVGLQEHRCVLIVSSIDGPPQAGLALIA